MNLLTDRLRQEFQHHRSVHQHPEVHALPDHLENLAAQLDQGHLADPGNLVLQAVHVLRPPQQHLGLQLLQVIQTVQMDLAVPSVQLLR